MSKTFVLGWGNLLLSDDDRAFEPGLERTSNMNTDSTEKIFLSTYERQPQNFEELLGMQGVGPKTIRALSLISELLYGARPSFNDPVHFSFAHGGKDGHPYPVDRAQYDRTIEILERVARRAKVGDRERLAALRRLASWEARTRPTIHY